MYKQLKLSLCHLIAHEDVKHPMNGWCEDHMRWGYVCEAVLILRWAVDHLEDNSVPRPITNNYDTINAVVRSLRHLGIRV